MSYIHTYRSHSKFSMNLSIEFVPPDGVFCIECDRLRTAVKTVALPW